MRTAHLTLIDDTLTVKEQYYLKMALLVAEKSDCTNKHGAVVVVNGTTVARESNRHRNHPSVVSPEHVKSGCTVHAEVAAIRAAGNCRGGTIYVARIGKFGPLLSRPCANCYIEIVNAGIKSIYHT
jgi:deoxycytidylate deaminase